MAKSTAPLDEAAFAELERKGKVKLTQQQRLELGEALRQCERDFQFAPAWAVKTLSDTQKFANTVLNS